MRDHWLIPTEPSKFGHPSTKPLKLVERMIIACSNDGDVVLDPFMGSGTTGVAALELNRKFIGFEISEDYVKIANKRILPYLQQKKLNNIL